MNMFVVLSFVSVAFFNIATVFGQEFVMLQQPVTEPATNQDSGSNYQLSGTFLLAPAQTVMDPVYVLPDNSTESVQQEQAPGVPYIIIPQQMPTPYMGQQYPQVYTIVNQQQAVLPVSYPQLSHVPHYDTNKQVATAPNFGYYPQVVQAVHGSPSGSPQQLFLVHPMRPGMNKVYPIAPDASDTPCQLLTQHLAAQNQLVLAQSHQ